MAIYKRLSVDAGGGIIDNFHKAQSANALNICIGLGGTGADAIRTLKKEVYRHIKPDDENSSIPTYKNIKYLLIDSDDSKIRAQDDPGEIRKQTEFFDISNGDIKTVMDAKEILKNRAELKWLNYGNIFQYGPARQFGRYLLIDKAAALKAKLTAVINEAMLGVTGDINVHIFSGLSGATGSGTFIDACYIVQNVLESLGRVGGSRVCGYFFLPDVNLSRPEIAADPLVSNHIRANGYAALKELDYLMNLEAEKGHFRQNYGTFSVDTVKPPVDLCYLISSKTANGAVIRDPYNNSLGVTANHVMHCLVRSEPLVSEMEKALLINPGSEALPDEPPYAAIGESQTLVQYADIVTYLGAKLFERFDFMYNRVLTEDQMQEFISRNRLGYDLILGEISKEVNFNISFPKYAPKDLIASNRQSVERCDAWLTGIKEKLQENCKNLEKNLQDYKIPKNSDSLIARIYYDLYTNYACDAKYGPFFAMQLLGGTYNINMLHLIDSYVYASDGLMKTAIRQKKRYEDELKNAEDELKNARTGLFGNAEKRSQVYLGALNNWYVHLANIEKYRYMQTLLRTLREQVAELNNNFFDVLTTVLDTVKNTFEDNARILAYGNEMIGDDRFRGQLDTIVSNLDVNRVMKDFVTAMLEHYPEWLSQDANKIAVLISELIIKQFSAITQKTIKDFLQMHKINPVAVIEILKQKEDPLFWFDPLFSQHYRKYMNNRKYRNIFVPYNVLDRGYAQWMLRASEGRDSAVQSGRTDCISLETLYFGIPLCAYAGIEDLKKSYESFKIPGLHLYEGEELDWRETLPDIDMKPQNEKNGYFH